MFSKYQHEVTKAFSESNKIKEEFKGKKEKLIIEIKNILSEECNNINEIILADYDPLKITNKITELNHRFRQLFEEEVVAQRNIKQILDSNLQDIIKCNIPTRRETISKYLLVSAVNDADTWICRVWFTLKKFKDRRNTYKRGDPIRIEWLRIPCDTAINNENKNIILTSNFLDQDERERKIPRFNSEQNIEMGIFYNREELSKIPGDQSFSWWEIWVENNRPN